MPEIHPDIAALGFLLGSWSGSGRGVYPTITPFEYHEQITIGHAGRPFLVYTQRTRRAGTTDPLHTETGYWRATDSGAELVIAQPTGVAEVLSGPIAGTSVHLSSTSVALTPTAKSISSTRRIIRVDGDVMTYEFWMEAVGQTDQIHLEATLRRDPS